MWSVTSSFGLIKISMVRNHNYTTGSIFWRIFRVSLAIFRTFFEINVHFVHKNEITTGTACAVKRDEDCRSIWEHPMMQIYDLWGLVLANQNARLRSRAQRV